MKKVLSSIVATLVAVSFAGIVFAQDAAAPAGGSTPSGDSSATQQTEKAPAKKHKKHKKSKKAKKSQKKEESGATNGGAAPAEAPAAK